MRQRVSLILVALFLVPVLGLSVLGQASAAPTGQCRSKTVPVSGGLPGSVGYEQKCTAQVPPGGSQTPGKAGGNTSPSCDVGSMPPATFCWGSQPCYIEQSHLLYEQPTTPPPKPGAEWQVRACFGIDPNLYGPFVNQGPTWFGTTSWVGQVNPPPPLVDQAREAFGLIELPTAALVFNPPGRTLVNVDTWFWAEGLSGGELRGTSAFGLVAVATPDRLEVTPGDGSATFSCEWVTTKSDTCSYPYRHSSVGGSGLGPDGRPAYRASAKATWTLTFEVNGAPTPVPGAPTVLRGPSMTTAVVVDEVQTLVTGAR